MVIYVYIYIFRMIVNLITGGLVRSTTASELVGTQPTPNCMANQFIHSPSLLHPLPSPSPCSHSIPVPSFILVEDALTSKYRYTMRGGTLDIAHPYQLFLSSVLANTMTDGEIWYAIPSHPIPSHPIPSHPIPSHPIPSHPIPSHPIPSHPIASSIFLLLGV